MPVNFLKSTKTQSVVIHFLYWIVRSILVIKLSGFAENSIFLTPAPVVSFLEDRHITYNIIIKMTSFVIMYVIMCDHVLLCLILCAHKSLVSASVLVATIISNFNPQKI